MLSDWSSKQEIEFYPHFIQGRRAVLFKLVGRITKGFFLIGHCNMCLDCLPLSVKVILLVCLRLFIGCHKPGGTAALWAFTCLLRHAGDFLIWDIFKV